ncbi:MAG: transposase [Ignavibacteriales bacterium]|nr:transposase [Ignavibacteriales bacterium]
MNKDRNYFKNTFHHLYNRGVNKNKIFFEDENYLFFLRKLKYYKEKYQIEILSYCLMPNHFHLFTKQKTEELLMSNFISDLLNSYVKSINKRYNRSGTLFESKTKNKLINDEQYFIWIIKYILENPVKAGIVNKINDWAYSNAKDLLGERNGNLVNLNEVKSFFQSEEVMKDFLLDKSIKVNYEI